MKLKSKTLALCLITLFLTTAVFSDKKIKVVTTTTDLASIVQAIGGNKVSVESIGRGYQNPHAIEAKPSHILKLQKADMFVKVGLELETWSRLLTESARNPKIMPGATGYVDGSEGCKILDIPQGKVDRSMGDVHPQGNPHYWLDPLNGKIIAGNISKALSKISPENKEHFEQNRAKFTEQIDSGLERWNKQMAPYKGTKIVTYHRSWPNFTSRFGLKVVDYVEPKPGIPPSPGHLKSLIEMMTKEGVKLILMEPFYSQNTAKSVAQKAGAKVLVLPPSVGGVKDVKDYIGLFDYNIGQVVKALSD